MRLLSALAGLFLAFAYVAVGDPLGLVDQVTSAAISSLLPAETRFAEFFIRSSLQTFLFLVPAVCLLAWGVAPLLPSERLDRALAVCTRHSGACAFALAGVAVIAAYLIAALALEFHPITLGDEHSYVFQARLFQSGRLYAPPPPEVEPFFNRAFIVGERWHGIGFGGHPLFLVPGLWFGSAHLTPALLAGLSVLLTYLLLRASIDRGTATLGALMVALSPLILSYHATLLPETTSLALNLAFLVGVVLGKQRARLWYYVPAALCFAAATVTRPQTAMIVGACVGVWLSSQPGPRWAWKGRALFALGVGAVVGVAGLLGYAHLVSGESFGSHLSPGYHRDELGGASAFGFSSAREIAGAFVSLGFTLIRLNFALLGWPVSWVAVGLWVLHRGKSGWEWALGSAAVGMMLLYFLYRARLEQYYVEAGYLFVLLGAIGVVRAYRVARTRHPEASRQRLLAAFVMCSFALGAIGVWPDRLQYFRERASYERTVWNTLDGAGLRRAVVYLEGLPGRYQATAGRNSPDLDDDVILAIVRDQTEIPRVHAHFPGRSAHRLVSDGSATGVRLVPYEMPPARTAPPHDASASP